MPILHSLFKLMIQNCKAYGFCAFIGVVAFISLRHTSTAFNYKTTDVFDFERLRYNKVDLLQHIHCV